MLENPPFVSIVIPVRNEGRILDRCLESIRNLEYPAERVEVIVADSLSTDDSRQIAESYGAKVVPNRRQTVVSGRNRGFEVAQGEFIAFTDADCIVRSDWLKAALNNFDAEVVAGVGGVTLFPDEATPFQKAVNVLFAMAGFTGSTAHRQQIETTQYVDDIPGCNCMYRRSALDLVMPIDEKLLTAEDVWLNWLLSERGYRHVASQHMVLWHHRRSRSRTFIRQMYRFAIGRLQVGKRARRLLKLSHVLVGLSVPLMVGMLLAAWACGLLWIPVATALLGWFGLFAVGVLKAKSWVAGFCLPMVCLLFVTSWSCGFLRELLVPMAQVDGK